MSLPRLGLLGFSQGFYATTFTEYLLEHPNVKVVGCCDLGKSSQYVRECAAITAEEFASKNNILLVHDLEDFFELKLDMILVATETWEHKKYTLEALRQGCHVFVCKPLSFLSKDVEEVIEASQGKGLVVLSGQPLRYESGFESVCEKTRSGKLGKVTNIRLLINHEAMLHQEWERDPAKSGGPLGTFGIYLFDIIRWATGQEFKRVYATGSNFIFPQINANDTVQINGVLTEGTLVSLNLVSTIIWPFPFGLMDIVGEKGVLRTNYDNYESILQGKDGVELGEIRYSPMGRREIYHFVDCCLGKAIPKITLNDALAAARCIEAVDKSIKLGRAVELC